MLQRADSRQVQMEYDEARVIAEKEVVKMIVDERRKKFKKDIEQAKLELERNLDKKMNEANNLKETQDFASAAWTILSVVRLWLARKELKRRCFETYEKTFSETYHAYYYRNKKTVSLTFHFYFDSSIVMNLTNFVKG